jgi:lysophospholipase L1-like esterase
MWLRTAAVLVPGIRRVLQQVVDYAQDWIDANKAALTQDYPLWVVLGDSMSQGVGATAYDKGWVRLLRDQFAKEGKPYRIINLSVSGARVEDVLQIQLPAMRKLGIQPALVTALVGSNNLINKRYRKTLVKGFGQMLDELPNGAVIGSLAQRSPQALAVNALLRQQAPLRHFKIADMTTTFNGPVRNRVSSDFFHPNDLGYSEMAATFKRAIELKP